MSPSVASATPRTQTKPLGFTALRRWLRHRHPMIMVDRIVDHEPGSFLTALMAVSGNTDTIAGHFPERGIYPGSNLIQAFSQCGIILYQMSTSPLEDDELTLVGSVQARFFGMVVPGDQVVFHVVVDDIIDKTFHFSGKATVDGKRVGAFRASLVRAPIKQMGNPLW